MIHWFFFVFSHTHTHTHTKTHTHRLWHIHGDMINSIEQRLLNQMEIRSIDELEARARQPDARAAFIEAAKTIYWVEQRSGSFHFVGAAPSDPFDTEEEAYTHIMREPQR